MLKKGTLIFLFICFSLVLVNASNDLSNSAIVSSTSSGCAGQSWGASCNIEVIKDGDRSTFFALPSSALMGDQRIVYEFSSMKRLDYINIEWTPGGNRAAPGNYYFSYYNGSDWITPDEWKAMDNNQGFNQTYTFELKNNVNAKGIQLVRPIQGDGKAIGVSEFHIFGSDINNDNLSNSTNSTNNTNTSTSTISISSNNRNNPGHRNKNTIIKVNNNSTSNITSYNNQNTNISLGKATLATKSSDSNKNMLFILTLSLLGLIMAFSVFIYIKKRIKDKEFGI